jgi:hypothetical protein
MQNKAPCYDGMRLVTDPEAEGYTYHAVQIGEWPGYWTRPLRPGEEALLGCLPCDPSPEQLPVSNEAA